MASTSSGDPSAAEALRRRRILSSRLYLDGVPSSKAPVVYSPAYDIEFNGIEKQHPFDSAKWGRVRNFLVDAGLLQNDRIVEPLEASEDDLLVVHSESYLSSLKSSAKVARIVEVPAVALLPNLLVQQKLLYPFRKQVGGSILSAKLALERGWAINIGGGFHHCSAEEGGGFCAYADISLCIHFAFVRLNISRVMIIDLDAHQGNGHEKDFGSDGRVYTLDMYNSGINNAGVMAIPFALSKDGIEMQFATNHVGHFLLTDLLLDTMKKTSRESNVEGRIVNVSSVGHKLAYREGIRFDKINDESVYSSMGAYGQSKLANILHANELARRFQEENVNITANSVHPGAIVTNLLRYHSILDVLHRTLGKLVLKNAEQGAATTCYVALHPQLKGVSGKYFCDSNLCEPNAKAKDMELAKRLWDFSVEFIS